MSDGIVRVLGIDIRYTDAGTGEPLVLLHSGGSAMWTWRKVSSRLARNRRIIAYDRPGWGGSGRPAPGQWQGRSPYGADGEVAVLWGLLQALGVAGPIALLGSSAGGTVAALAGARAPERVRKLILCAPGIYSGLGRGLAPAWARALFRTRPMRALGPRLIERSFKKSFRTTVARFFHDRTLVTEELLNDWARAVSLPGIGRTLCETMIASAPLGLAAGLPRMAVPALVVAGDDDRYVPLAENERLAREWPGAELKVVNACGHLPQEEKPEELVGAVEAFLDRKTTLPGRPLAI